MDTHGRTSDYQLDKRRAVRRFIGVAQKIEGEIVRISDCGNLVTNISRDQLEGVPRDESVSIACDGHSTIGIYEADHGQPPLTLIAVLGEDDVLEILLVEESAAKFLGIVQGTRVTVSW